jgi:hypothetical protein
VLTMYDLVIRSKFNGDFQRVYSYVTILMFYMENDTNFEYNSRLKSGL